MQTVLHTIFWSLFSKGDNFTSNVIDSLIDEFFYSGAVLKERNLLSLESKFFSFRAAISEKQGEYQNDFPQRLNK